MHRKKTKVFFNSTFFFLTSFRPLTVLVGLYEEPERPPNAVEYVKKIMGAPVGVDVDALRAENEQLRQMVDRLTKE